MGIFKNTVEVTKENVAKVTEKSKKERRESNKDCIDLILNAVKAIRLDMDDKASVDVQLRLIERMANQIAI